MSEGKPPTCSLADRDCVPCRGGIPPLKGDTLRSWAEQLGNGWELVEEHHLHKAFSFQDFRQALDFTTGRAVATAIVGWLILLLVQIITGVSVWLM